jgi:DNA-binding NarL/FixJ family response regulator
MVVPPPTSNVAMVVMKASPCCFRAALIGEHPLLLQPLALWLTQSCGIETTFVSSADRALADRCLAFAPDVVVVDQFSANGAAITIVRNLRSFLPEIRMVLLADRADSAAKAVAIATGCDGVIGKDQTADTFVSLLRSARELAVPAVGDDSLVSTSFVTPPPRLTLREQEVLRLLAAGLSTPRIGVELQIANNTTRAHVQRVIEKLGAHSKLEAVALARRAGVITC